MRKLIAFESVSLDGYFTDANGDMSWAHKNDPEWNAFASSNASGDGALLFGRVTYEMMASFWPTPAAMETLPEVAKGMNRMPKFVFSRTLDVATWSNTTIVKGDLAGEVRKMKNQSGPGIAILGSGSIVSQLTEARLIDEYQLVFCPVVLGSGRTLFESVKERTPLERLSTRSFDNGNVVSFYRLMV